MVHEEAQEYLDWHGGPESCMTNRIDIVRDYDGVKREQQVLDALSLVPGAGRLNARYRNDHMGGAETLTRGTPGRVTASLYSKHAERVYQAQRARRDADRHQFLLREAELARGQVRYEVRVRKPVALEKGIGNLMDITNEQIDQIARDCHRRFGFAHPVGGADAIDRAIEQGIPNAVLGALLKRSRGLDPGISHNTADKYSSQWRQYGISEADFATVMAEPLVLDYDLGVLRAA